MTGSSRFVPIDAHGESRAPDAEAAPMAAPAPPPSADDLAEYEPQPRHARRAFLAPALAGLALAGWTGLLVWANASALATGGSPAQWLGWIEEWSGPVAVLGIVWLLAQRPGRQAAAQAESFADNTAKMASEAGLLEARLTTVNAELSIAREFIAAQSRDLESLGRLAGERLSQHAERLALLIRDNGAQLDAIGAVSSAALENMERLRGQLPVIASAAKDVTNNIANSGRAAQAQIGELEASLRRLDDSGAATETRAATLRSAIDDALAQFAARAGEFDAFSTSRLDALRWGLETLHGELQAGESEALAAMRHRAAELGQELRETRGRLDEEEAAALVSLRARLSALREEASSLSRALLEAEATALADAQTQFAGVSERQASLLHQISSLRGEYADATNGLEVLEVRALALSEAAEQSRGALEARFAMLDEKLAGGEQHLADTGALIASLTESAVRLLELIQASASHSSEILPAAIGENETRLAGIESRIFALRENLGEASARGEDLSHTAQATSDTLRVAMGEFGAFHENIDAHARSHGELLASLRQSLAALDSESGALAGKAGDELTAAIAALHDAASAAGATIREEGAAAVSEMARQLGEQSGAAIGRAMRTEAAALTGQLEQAAAHAAGVGREAGAQLREQVARVDELVASLEARTTEARERAQEQVDNGFSRRAALITEALNSNAIEIAKALESDVPDTAWASYLKGDRGIFTRRAVRLLDSGDAKTIARIYHDDDAFREHVSHYIADFEGMLRQLLATRDGEALGVTLLSSDMGKLYVALAQAINRLRS